MSKVRELERRPILEWFRTLLPRQAKLSYSSTRKRPEKPGTGLQ
jgi:hypothetical protein